MAKNTGDNYRQGAVKDKSQSYNSKTETWMKRGDGGKFESGKKDGTPYKGVRKER